MLLDYPIKKTGLSAAKTSSWRNHPAVGLWRGFSNALIFYYNTSLDVFTARGYTNMLLKPIIIEGDIVMPPWFGDNYFHRTHRSQLLYKGYERFSAFEGAFIKGNYTKDRSPHKTIDWYRQFKWKERPGEFPYVWPNALEMIAMGTTSVKKWLTRKKKML